MATRRDRLDHEAHSDVSGGLASRVLLDRRHGTATKEYRPPFLVKALYWLAFQAPFPYVRNEASLRAARARRIIASLLTKFWFGRDLVAPTLDIRCDEEGCLFVTQLIEGEVPKDRKRARAFLREVAPRFQEVGLPTWQINPWNPKATGNLIETPGGGYKIIDLESGVVSPMMPLGQWADAVRAGLIPVFDDVFVARTRRYVESQAAEIAAALGADGLSDLRSAVDEYQDCAEQWQRSELRVWGRLMRLVLKAGSLALKPLRLFWPPSLIGSARGAIRRARDARQIGSDWARAAIEQLVDEGSLDPGEAEKAMRSLEAPETLAVLGHLGAHVAISVPLRFPFGSIARFLWTSAFRLKAEARALLRRASGEETRGARKVHTFTVAVLSGLPGLGTFAYLAAEPLRKNRPLLAVLLDQALRRLPFDLYHRQHLAVLSCWLACSGPSLAPRVAKDRWHRLRPHHLAVAVTETVRSTRAHAGLAGGIVAASAAAVIAGGVAYLTTGNLSLTFGEFGPVQTLKAGMLLLAGVAGYLIYTRFWRLPGAEQRVDAPGSFFWLLSGLGLLWLGTDDYFQLHERAGDFLEEGLGMTVPLLNNPDDLIVLGYGIAALSITALFLGELMRSRAVLPLLAIGVTLMVISLGVDFFVPEGTSAAGVEDPANVLGAGFLLSAYVVKLREVSAQLPTAAPAVAFGGAQT